MSNINSETKIITSFCEDLRIKCFELQPTQFRLISEDQKTVDIYPVNKKFHIISCNARGQYTDLLDFLNFIF